MVSSTSGRQRRGTGVTEGQKDGEEAQTYHNMLCGAQPGWIALVQHNIESIAAGKDGLVTFGMVGCSTERALIPAHAPGVSCHVMTEKETLDRRSRSTLTHLWTAHTVAAPWPVAWMTSQRPMTSPKCPLLPRSYHSRVCSCFTTQSRRGAPT